MEMKENVIEKNIISKNLIDVIEKKYLRSDLLTEKNQIKVGDIIKIGYKIPEGDKERIQSYEGLVISINNRTLGRTITIRRNVQGIGIEQIFLLHSPKIASITRKQSSKVRRAKLYFIRGLSGKSTRLKIKR